MDVEGGCVKGIISVLHRNQDGKHLYEVENVILYNKSGFTSKGDKFLMINDVEIQDLAPEALAEMLAKGSPMLTIHQSNMDNPAKECQEPGDLHATSKEETFLRLSLEMFREEDLENDGEDGESSGVEEESGDKDSGSTENGSDDVLIIALKETSISVVTSRGCGEGCPFEDCEGIKCHYSDVVLSSNEVILLHTGTLNLKRYNKRVVFLRSCLNQKYFDHTDSQAIIREKKQESAKITIYSYQTEGILPSPQTLNKGYKGIPVVLNFTGTEAFLRCTKEGGSPVVSVDNCEKSKLRCISQGAADVWPFVFYMSSDPSGNRRFESANCEGWFLKAEEEDRVILKNAPKDDSFYFLIQNVK